MNKQKRKRKNVSEFQPPNPRIIESARPTISQTDIESIQFINNISSSFLRKIRNCYIYEINFPINSQLQKIHYSSFRFLNLYSITLPPSLSIIFPEAFKNCFNLKQVIFSKNEQNKCLLHCISDESLKDTKINSIIIPETVKEIGYLCFPKCLSKIDFENGCPNLKKIGNNTFSFTQIEKLDLPSNISPFVISKNVFLRCQKLKEINFDHFLDKNQSIFFEYNDRNELNERKSRKEKFNEDIQKIENNNFQFEISQDLAKSLLLCQTKIEKIEVLASNLNYFYFYNTPNLTSIVIPKSDNSRYVKINGCLYTKDKKKLIVAERNIKNHVISSDCQIITNYAFNFKSLEKVSFEKNSKLKEISFLAFYDSQITEIDIPNSVDLISYGAFYKCKKLNSISISNSMNSIDFFTFSYTNITKIIIPKTIVRINFGSFYGCFNLKNVLFEKESELIEIDDFAFANTKIESISIPKSVKRIGYYCFLNCYNLKSIRFENELNYTKIEFNSFTNTQISNDQINQFIDFSFKRTTIKRVNYMTFIRPNLSEIISEIYIPPYVEEIGYHAFFDCPNLIIVEITDFKNSKLKKIFDGAFYNCNSLSAFDIPAKVNYFGMNSFKNCVKYYPAFDFSNCNKIVICKNAFENSGISSFHSKSRKIKIGDFAFKNCFNLNHFISNASLKCEIGESAFLGCKSLKEVSINPDVDDIKIGPNCFMNSSIEKFYVPKNLKEIPKSCFKFCEKLNNIIIDDFSNLRIFRSEAFLGSKLNQIFIPYKTKKIEKSCFEKCQKLFELTFSLQLKKCILKENAFYGSGIKELYISKGIKRIEFGCFEKCINLKKVTFSDEIIFTKIYDNVFKSTGIETIICPKNINSIGNYSFANCTKLESITFTNKKVDISSSSFFECNQIKSIKCDEKIVINSQYSFEQEKINEDVIKSFIITNLKMIHFDYNFYKNNFIIFDKEFKLNNDDIIIESYIPGRYVNNGYYHINMNTIYMSDLSIESIKISKLTKYIMENAFTYTSLKKIDFEVDSKLEMIGKSSFRNLLIEEICIPDSVNYICDFAFCDCIKLKTVKISTKSQLKSIGCNAFENCLIESILFPSTLTNIDKFAFLKCNNLKKIDNFSNQIIFGIQSFYKTPIEHIKFPSNANFGDSSFRHCKNLKKLIFLKEPEKIIFGVDSFASSGLKSINLKCNVDIKEYAFSFCENLTKVQLIGNNIKCVNNPFYCSNINQIYIEANLEIYKPRFNQELFLSRIEKDIINSTIEKLLLKFKLKNNYDENELNKTYYLHHNCLSIDDELCYVNLFDNSDLFKQEDEVNEIKKNEIILMPNNIKNLNFQIATHLKKIKFHQNCEINDLGKPGFFAYSNITDIIIPKLVMKIPPRLFEHCHYLKEVHFEKGTILKEIGEFSFSNTRIQNIYLPKSVQIIKQAAFSNNKYLKSVFFNGEIIEDKAFYNTGITKFNLSNDTRIIGSCAFQYCHDLTEFNININDSNITEIGQYAFADSSITSINIPSKLKTIQKFCFNNCKFLKKVKFSSDSILEEIEDYSFAGDLLLEKINIPKTITKLSHTSFINTPSLLSIMTESNSIFKVMNNNVVYLKHDINQDLIFVPRNLKQFNVAQNCITIYSGAFCGSYIEKVSLPDLSLNCIEKSAFAHSKKLKKIKIPETVQKIEEEAFIDCENLEIIEFHSSCLLIEIPSFCFAFSGLKTINLPRSIEIIKDSSFYFCSNLKNINLFNTNIKYIGHSAFSGTSIENIVFPHSIQCIENHAFENTKFLKIVDFSHCYKIKSSINIDRYMCLKKIKKRSKARLNYKNIKKIQTNSSSSNLSAIFEKKSPSNQNSPLIIKPAQSQSFLTPNIKTQSSTNNNLINPKSSQEEDKKSANVSEFCFIRNSSFYNSSVKIFKFDLKKYKWFNFFDKCIQIIEYSVNSNIQIFLKKLPKEKPQKLIGGFYKVIELIWQNNDTLPWKTKNSISLSIFNFLNTTKLTTIYLSNDINIKKIPKCTFQYTKLKEITIPSSVLRIGISAFKHCYKLEKVTFLKNSLLKKIGRFAFYRCKKLKSISIPNNVKMISNKCFSFSGLNQISLPSSIEKIDEMAFYNCNELSQIELNEGLNEIGISSFANNCSLQNINIPNSLKIINKKAFQNCVNLNKIYINENTNLIEIHNEAFENTQIEELMLNTKIKIIFEPKNVHKLNKISFFTLKNLTNFKQFEDGTIYSIQNYGSEQNEEELLRKISTFAINNTNFNEYKALSYKLVINHSKRYKLIFAPKNLKYLKIQEGCNSISDFVFNGMKNLKTIEYVKGKSNLISNFNISKSNNCNIKQIKILGHYSFIENFSFSNFQSLEIVEFGESTNIFFIPKFAFENCTKLKKINIPESCSIIEEGSFKNCINLESVIFNKNQKEAIRKSGIEFIGKEAFFNCSSLQLIVIPPSIKSIGEKSFMNCSKLKNFKFDDSLSLESIGDFAFKNCSSLKSFKIDKNCTKIGRSIFMNCTSMNTILIKRENQLVIPYHSFYNCSSLKTFKLIHDHYIKNIDIGYESFMNCSSLEEFIIGDSPSTKENDENGQYNRLQMIKNRAFYNCKSLKNVHIFNGRIDKINDNAFSNCYSLEKVEINSKYKLDSLLKNINSNAFVNVKNNLIIKIFGNPKECYSLRLFDIKKSNKTGKLLFEDHFSFLNKSFLSSESEKNDKETKDLNKNRKTRFIDDKLVFLFSQRRYDQVCSKYFPKKEMKLITLKSRTGPSMFEDCRDYQTEYYYVPTDRPPLNI